MRTSSTATVVPTPRGLQAFRWPLALALGAAVVALSAQVVVPLPVSPVPLTLQGLAVILVGGMLGSTAGAGAMAVYLAAGAIGLPVFAGGAGGLARLLGPTGGYLLAFPVAAALVGRVGRRGSPARCLAGAALGMLAIHAGGVAQLTLLGGSAERAVEWGFLPFLVVDSLKVLAAALVLWRAHAVLRPRA